MAVQYPVQYIEFSALENASSWVMSEIDSGGGNNPFASFEGSDASCVGTNVSKFSGCEFVSASIVLVGFCAGSASFVGSTGIGFCRLEGDNGTLYQLCHN